MCITALRGMDQEKKRGWGWSLWEPSVDACMYKGKGRGEGGGWPQRFGEGLLTSKIERMKMMTVAITSNEVKTARMLCTCNVDTTPAGRSQNGLSKQEKNSKDSASFSLPSPLRASNWKPFLKMGKGKSTGQRFVHFSFL